MADQPVNGNGSEGVSEIDVQPTGPSVEELLIDEDLSQFERVQQYSRSEFPLQQLYHVNILGDVSLRITSFSDLESIILPLVEELCSIDKASVREAALLQIPTIARACISIGQDTGISVVSGRLLPTSLSALGDRQAVVKEAAFKAIYGITVELPRKHRHKLLVAVISNLAQNHSDEDSRQAAAELTKRIVHLFSTRCATKHLLPIMKDLVADSAFRVRRVVASTVVEVARLIGPRLSRKLVLPLFIRLTNDEIWGVRKTATEAIVALSHCLDPSLRRTKLTNCMLICLDDVSRWVRSSAYQALGPFIASVVADECVHVSSDSSSESSSSYESSDSSTSDSSGDCEEISDRLVAAFVSMTDSHVARTSDADIPQHCAFAFPGVLQSLGAERWTELAGSYQLLVRDGRWKVRRTLAFSLHHVARLLGPYLAERELLPAFDLFLRDLDEVKVGVLSNMAEFLASITPETRERYVAVIGDVYMECEGNWRYREIIGQQLPLLAKLFDSTVLVSVIQPLLFQLTQDRVATVRSAALEGIASLVTDVNGCSEWDSFIHSVVGMAAEHSYHERQMYLELCGYCMDSSIFDQHLLIPMLSLVNDPVTNVRMMLATTLYNIMAHHPSDQVSAAIDTLKNDPENDVVIAAYGGSVMIENEIVDSYAHFAKLRDGQQVAKGRRSEGRCTTPPTPPPEEEKSADDVVAMRNNIDMVSNQLTEHENEDGNEPVDDELREWDMNELQAAAAAAAAASTATQRTSGGAGAMKRNPHFPMRGGRNTGGYPGHDGDRPEDDE